MCTLSILVVYVNEDMRLRLVPKHINRKKEESPEDDEEGEGGRRQRDEDGSGGEQKRQTPAPKGTAKTTIRSTPIQHLQHNLHLTLTPLPPPLCPHIDHLRLSKIDDDEWEWPRRLLTGPGLAAESELASDVSNVHVVVDDASGVDGLVGLDDGGSTGGGGGGEERW